MMGCAQIRGALVFAICIFIPAASPASAQQQPTPQVVNQCNITGGENYGRQMLTCIHTSDEMVLIRPRGDDMDERVRDSDGTFIQEFVYRIANPITVDFNLCAPDILSVTGVSLSGRVIANRRLPADRPNCIKTRFMEISGVFALAVRTRRPDSELDVDAVIPIPTMIPPTIFVPPPLPPPVIFTPR